MHSKLFCSLCVCVIALACWGHRFESLFDVSVILGSVCLIGVPHGGPDHLTGRKYLSKQWGNFWVVPFFGVYLTIAILTVCGWLLCPLFTAIAFFSISACHFGQGDDLVSEPYSRWRVLLGIASGGLVIWVPAIARPAEMQQILNEIIPNSIAMGGGTIVYCTQFLAIAFIPVALAEVLSLTCSPSARSQASVARAVRQTILFALFTFAPIPISFAVYFCGWHSIRGLQDLMREHEMKIGELMLASLPMSVGAIALIGLGMWFWYSGRELSVELTRTLFIGLSAIAVPHLALNALPKRRFDNIEGLAAEVRGVA